MRKNCFSIGANEILSQIALFISYFTTALFGITCLVSQLNLNFLQLTDWDYDI
jgi:uncharacterized membrane protein